MTIFLIVLFQAILFLTVLFLSGIDIQPLILFSLLFSFLKLEILLSIVLFFSTFMSNILTVIISLMIYFISHSFSLILDMVMRTKNVLLVYFSQFVNIIFPPLEAINIKDYIGSFQDFPLSFLLSNSLYSLLYICVLLTLTLIIFNKKKFEG